jgi:hypothetical protein
LNKDWCLIQVNRKSGLGKVVQAAILQIRKLQELIKLHTSTLKSEAACISETSPLSPTMTRREICEQN